VSTSSGGKGETAAILLAAGSSRRMGEVDKLWADLGGVPVLAYSIVELATSPQVDRLVIVAPEAHHPDLIALVPSGVEVQLVEGGARRQDSVAAGVAAAPDAAWYLVHDGARPFVTKELVARVLEGAREAGAAVPGVHVADTIKRVDDAGRVEETLQRASLRAIQTPQAFAGELLRRAHAEVTSGVTDDAAMVEALGEPVLVVEGDARNLKLTTPVDLEQARGMVEERHHESRHEPRAREHGGGA
jgi:2-C-methyl-D-erythritol 4-phosphate cytidylyltransferase